MNYFTKNRILVWIVIAAFAINISAIVTILYHVNKGKAKFKNENSICQHKSHDFFKNELNLNPEQEKQFIEIKETSKKIAEPIVLKMKEKKIALMEALLEKNPDSNKIFQISNEIQLSQALLLQHTIKHYLDLKKILKVDQQEKLNILYQDLFGCPRMQMDKKCGDNCGKHDGSGEGNGDGSGGGNGEGKRHRHGGNRE
ncbi:MAG: Spy/CpxP family protein refolding chaperone [Bacteroidales bacterium]